MIKITPDEVRKETLLPYLEKNYSKLTKKQLYDITTKYIYAAYMLNGHLHVLATSDMLKSYEE